LNRVGWPLRSAAERLKRSERVALNARYARLTPREREVLPFVVAGFANKQTAGVHSRLGSLGVGCRVGAKVHPVDVAKVVSRSDADVDRNDAGKPSAAARKVDAGAVTADAGADTTDAGGHHAMDAGGSLDGSRPTVRVPDAKYQLPDAAGLIEDLVRRIAAADADGGLDGEEIRYAGGNGMSCEHAVLILGASDDLSGVLAEYRWINEHYPGVYVVKQWLTDCAGEPADVLRIRTPGGDTLDVYFNIRDFFGR
jgi:hypothetical protein